MSTAIYFPKTRTTVGNELWRELCKAMSADQALKEIDQRLQVRAERVAEDVLKVETSLDGGPWTDDGRYTE